MRDDQRFPVLGRLRSGAPSSAALAPCGLPDLKNLRFGIFLAYGYGPAGVGAAHNILPLLSCESRAGAGCSARAGATVASANVDPAGL